MSSDTRQAGHAIRVLDSLLDVEVTAREHPVVAVETPMDDKRCSFQVVKTFLRHRAR